MPWWKGNTHVHTDRSDGDAALEEVAGWYEAHGWDFLVVTDHDRVTDVSAWNAAGRPLLLLPGCEVSLTSQGRPVHVNALGTAVVPRAVAGPTITATLQAAVDAVRAAGGVPQVNHPNYRWALDDTTLRQATGWSLLEVYNASSDCNNLGGGGRPGVEEIWDRLLAAGRRVWAVAADDAHHWRREWWGHCSPPGRAWIMVRAAACTPHDLLGALERGEFYASTEVRLDAIDRHGDTLAVEVAPERDFAYSTEFIGRGGTTLAVVHGPRAQYVLRGDEGYVRARVRSSNGGWAWTQPWLL